ncbi:MAG: hypothetical protein PHH61_06380 [Candidatus Nanoarchaeia archaeon]|jgi:hypothetical protein|nr:hypothetical protein [Candidatus Nanoarchaeia archaeon]
MTTVEIEGFISQIIPVERMDNYMLPRNVDWSKATGKDMILVCFCREIFPEMKFKRLVRIRTLFTERKLNFHSFSPQGSLPIWVNKGHGLSEGDKIRIKLDLQKIIEVKLGEPRK